MCRAGDFDHCDTSYAEANGTSYDGPTHGAPAQHVTVDECRVQHATACRRECQAQEASGA